MTEKRHNLTAKVNDFCYGEPLPNVQQAPALAAQCWVEEAWPQGGQVSTSGFISPGELLWQAPCHVQGASLKILVNNAPRPLGRDTSLCEACHSLGHSSVVSLPLSTWPKGWSVLFWMSVVKYSLPGHCLKAHLLQGVKRHAQSLDLSLVYTPCTNSHKASKLAP